MKKIFTRVVIDIGTRKILEADSYDYEGPVAEAKGGSSQTNTELPRWLRPYAEQFIGAYQGQVFDEQGNVIQQPGDVQQQIAGFNPLQESAMSNIAGMSGVRGPSGPGGKDGSAAPIGNGGGGPITGAFNPNLPGGGSIAGGGGGVNMQDFADLGVGQSAATLGGSFLHPESNPFLEATFNKAARGLTDQYQTAIAPSIAASAQRSGNAGGSAEQELMAHSRFGLGENLGNLATSIYGGAYGDERNRQLQTLGLLPSTIEAGYSPQDRLLGVGAMQQQQSQSELDTDYLNALSRTQFPFEILSGMGGALGQAGMGSGQSTVRTSGGGIFGK